LGTTTSQPHIPIFVSSDIGSKTRVVLIFGETYQDLGVLAHRVLSGPGGIDKGSMVSVIKEIGQQRSSPADSSPPGIILANTGQTHFWSPELQRPLTIAGSEGAPMPSAAHCGISIREGENRVPENGNMREHIRYIFEKVVPAFVGAKAGLDILAVGDAADAVEQYLDWGVTWGRLEGMINCMAIVGGYHPVEELQCEGFVQFLREVCCISYNPFHLSLFAGIDPKYALYLPGICPASYTDYPNRKHAAGLPPMNPSGPPSPGLTATPTHRPSRA
jgi:hypothetical protein